jgi:orotate phosphoribosyltransferase
MMGVTERLKAVKNQFCEIAKQNPALAGIDIDKVLDVGSPARQEYGTGGNVWVPYLHHKTALKVEGSDEDALAVRSKLENYIASYDGNMSIRRALNPFLDAASQFTALTLLELGAVKLNVKQPFTYASKNKGPVYVDNRFLVTESKHKGAVASFMAEMLDNEVYSEINMIVGGETAGMAPAERLAQLINLPYFYVRKEAKQHGKKSTVVGNPAMIKPPALLVEDLITDGGSKLTFIDNMRAEGASCNVVFVIFDRLQGGADALLRQKACELYSITDLQQTRKVAVEKGYISVEDDANIEEYLKDSRKWNLDRGYDWYENNVVVEKASITTAATA